MLTFRRKKPRLTDVARITEFVAIEVPLAIVQIECLLAEVDRRRRKRYLAIHRHENSNESILGRHRTRSAAQRTCERFARSINALASPR